MSRDINWERRTRVLDGVYGINPYKKGRSQTPTKEQIDYINALVEELEANNIEARWVLKDGRYAKFRAEAVYVIRVLRKMKADNGLFKPSRTVYINLCREKETGKKIKYRTSKFCAAPVGYEFIGQLSKEITYETD